MPHRYRTVEDFLKDESFISYCLRSNEQDIRYWETFIAENPGKRELVEEAVHEYRLLFTALANADVKEQLDDFKKKVEGNEQAPVVELNTIPVRRRWFTWQLGAALAAAVMIMIAGSYLYHKSPTAPSSPAAAIQYTCKQGERKSFQFPDGTQVMLNAASEISLNNNYGKNTREVFLKGEAFFEVQHNVAVPFIVHTASMDVKAVGTAFNVKSYSNEGKTETVLIRGLVEVTLKKDNNRRLLLHPDEKIMWVENKTVNDAGGPVSAKNNSTQPAIKPVTKLDNGNIKEVAWIQNDLAFDDEPFEEIAAQLSRWYNVNIQFASEDIKQYHFTATFKKEKIEQVLNILKASKKFNYRFEGANTIIIEH
jgi:ferric-dicitrate binding protein FerR (iron transport regulator)